MKPNAPAATPLTPLRSMDALRSSTAQLWSANAAWIKANMPASLGKPFSPGG